MFILVLCSYCVDIQAQKIILTDGDSVTIPPFRESFQKLAKNRTIYNTYNDSIFAIKDHDRWVSFFRRRALKNQQLYASDKVLLGNIFDYFKRDTTYEVAYLEFFYSYFYDYRRQAKTDPFFTLEVCKVIEEYNKQAPVTKNLSNMVNIWEGEAYDQMHNLGQNPGYMKKSAEYYKKVMAEDAKRYAFYDWCYPQALWALLSNQYLLNKSVTIQEHNEYYMKLKEWYAVHQGDTTFGAATWKSLKIFLQSHDESLLRNVYLVDSTVLKKDVADSLMHAIIKRNLADEKLSDLSFVRTCLLQVKCNQLTASQAVDLCLERYDKSWSLLLKQRLDNATFSDYLRPFNTFFYLNDISDKSFRKKRKIVKRICKDIELAYQLRLDQQTNTGYVKTLNMLTTYPRLTKYLKPNERVLFLYALNVATQVTTYAHSVHVAMIARELMAGILKYHPELLVGTHGYRQITDILKHQKDYLNFCYYAGIFHDLGKNSIISVVNNDYRPLFDEEYAIIKTHPELGLQYLELDPKLAKYHDTTLGHHKWYNGKGGYPENFDNTKSPDRILIDLVTLADCMQAATEHVGRNYKGDKSFEAVMEEFRRDAGVKYNPDLVALIDAHPDLSKKLAELVNNGWADIYYNIYSQFVR